jgi:hypothetical protein
MPLHAHRQISLVVPEVTLHVVRPVTGRARPLDAHEHPQETYVNQCPTPLKSIVTMREFTTKTEILLYNVQMEEEQYDSLITLHQETTGIKPKSLNINIKRKKRKGIFEILLSARIVIINETGLPLLVYLDECKSS